MDDRPVVGCGCVVFGAEVVVVFCVVEESVVCVVEGRFVVVLEVVGG